MFLTQRLPWAVQRALREYGWMSVLGRLSNCKHLEAGGVRPMFMRAGSLHGGSCLLLHEQIKRWKQGPPPQHTHTCHRMDTHTHTRTHTHTHYTHNTWRLSFFPSFPPPSTWTHMVSHTATHSPPSSWLDHNGRLMSPRPSGPPQGALQLWPPSPPFTPPS